MNRFLEIGKIVGTHGLKGDLKFDFWCNDLGDFSNVKLLFDKSRSEYKFLKIRQHGNIALLNLEGIDSIEKAEKLKGQILLVRKDELPALPEGKYYLDDLLGFEGYLSTGQSIGKLTDFIDSAGRLIYVFSGEKEVLIPNIPEFIEVIEFENKRMIINNIEGLI